MAELHDVYLGCLKYRGGKYCAPNATAKNGSDGRFYLNKNALLIKSLQIDASIYSPPVLKVVCFVDKFPIEKILPYYSVFGVVLIVSKYDTMDEDVDFIEEYCLFANTRDSFTPFVVLDVKDRTKDCVTIILMEKRALSLALTHSFACIGRGSRNSSVKHYSDYRFLSIAELVENLSIIPEDDDPRDEEGKRKDKKSSKMKIFNFDAYCTLNSDTGEVDTFSTQEYINYQTSNYAVLSRFIAPSAQSRLEIISSLMCKYGYGFAFKPEDRQYYAVDLLSNYAPGFYNGRTTRCYAGTYKDRYYFNTKNPESYFENYGCKALIHLKYTNLGVNFENEREKREYEDEHFLSHDFTDFYAVQLIGRCNEDLEPAFFQSSTGWNNYGFIARHSPLSSATNLLLHNNKVTPGYDLSISSKIKKGDWRDIPGPIPGTDKDFASIILQDDLNVHTEGSQTSLFEDQVKLNIDKPKTKKNKITAKDIKIKSVNQRLAYAKYKLNHLRQNYITQTFEFCHNEGLLSCFNIVYSLFWWLGVHTDVFSRIANEFKMVVEKHNNPEYNEGDKNIKEFIPTPSGFSHSIYENLTHATLDKYTKFFTKYPMQYFLFSYNSHLYQNKEALFGKLSIFIERVNEKTWAGGIVTSYSTSATLTFYSDFTDCNIGTRIDQPSINKDKDADNNSYSIVPDESEREESEDEKKEKELEIPHDSLSSFVDEEGLLIPRGSGYLKSLKGSRKASDNKKEEAPKHGDGYWNDDGYKDISLEISFVDGIINGSLNHSVISLTPSMKHGRARVNRNIEPEVVNKPEVVKKPKVVNKPEVEINNESVDRLQKNSSQEEFEDEVSEGVDSYIAAQLRIAQAHALAHALKIRVAKYKLIDLNAKNKKIAEKENKPFHEIKKGDREYDDEIEKIANNLKYDDVFKEAKYIPREDESFWSMFVAVKSEDFSADEPES